MEYVFNYTVFIMYIPLATYFYVLNTIYNNTLEGENFHGFCGFSLTANVLPLKIFLFIIRKLKLAVMGKLWKFFLHNEYCWQTAKVFLLECFSSYTVYNNHIIHSVITYPYTYVCASTYTYRRVIVINIQLYWPGKLWNIQPMIDVDKSMHIHT